MLADISVGSRDGRSERPRTSRQEKINDKPWRFEFRGNGMSWGVLRVTQETRSWISTDASAEAAPPNCGIHLTPMKHALTNTLYTWLNSNSAHYSPNLHVYMVYLILVFDTSLYIYSYTILIAIYILNTTPLHIELEFHNFLNVTRSLYSSVHVAYFMP